MQGGRRHGGRVLLSAALDDATAADDAPASGAMASPAVFSGVFAPAKYARWLAPLLLLLAAGALLAVVLRKAAAWRRLRSCLRSRLSASWRTMYFFGREDAKVQ